MSDKLDLQSPDLVNQNIDKLAALFPNCVTEGPEGKSIDFDLLRQELNHQVVEGTKERYRLEWPGKKEAIVTANLPTTKTLRPIREDSVDFDNTENLYIEGDNLEVLKLLQESYLGKVKMIYIDPPYNTGKDFVYKDNFTKDISEELLESGQKDEYNHRLVSNPETSGRYHSDWLSMMYPRLKLARNLLTEEGVIFISIDDKEVQNLKKICDEIFGENNSLGTIVWKKKTNGNNMGYIPPVHDYFICYAKKESEDCLLGFKLSQDFLDRTYSNPDGDPRGPWTTSDLSANHKGPHFKIINPNTGGSFYPPEGRYWVFNEGEIEKRIRDGRVIFGKQGDGRPIQKKFLSERSSLRKKAESWWDNYGMNEDGSREISELFSPKIFDHPKPSITLKNLAEISTEGSDLILDFFSGSASIAQSIFKLNSEDQGKRKFILVQIPELTDEKSEARQAGYKNICELGKERIRRAGRKIKKDTRAQIDFGFRVFRLDSSNMQDVYYRPQDVQQGSLDLFADHIKPDRNADDLLAQVMLDWGLPLSLKIVQKTVSGKKVFQVAGNSLTACFDSGIDEAFAKEIAADKPLRIVFRDASFRSDTAKENVKQLLKQLSPETEMKVI